MVITDSLSGLYNRRYFYLRLNSEIQRAMRYGRSFSLLILDVDDFKKINDDHGHQKGDEVLKGISEIIKSSLRFRDFAPEYDLDVPCRFGGEEFAVILPEASSIGETPVGETDAHIEASGARTAAEKLRKNIERARSGGLGVTVSVGVACFPTHGNDLETIVRAADDAMYRGKALGKNTVVVAEMDPAGLELEPSH